MFTLQQCNVKYSAEYVIFSAPLFLALLPVVGGTWALQTAAAATHRTQPDDDSSAAPLAQRNCTIPSCPEDFVDSTIGGIWPNGSSPHHDPCLGSATTCVRDVLPGCTNYASDSDAQWGALCATAIAGFDSNRTLPQNIGTTTHPIYYFEPVVVAKEKAYVLYIPPSGNLPISAQQGRYDYFLLQFFKAIGIGVFLVRTPEPTSDLWDHVPAHNKSSPYEYDCHNITYDQPPLPPILYDLCTKNRSTAIIEAAIDKAVARGYEKQIVMGWSSGGAMASAFLAHAHRQGFVTRSGARYTMDGLVLLHPRDSDPRNRSWGPIWRFPI
jgi:hypothetical protein